MVPKMVRSIALISQTPSIHCLVRGLFLKLETNRRCRIRRVMGVGYIMA